MIDTILVNICSNLIYDILKISFPNLKKNNIKSIEKLLVKELGKNKGINNILEDSGSLSKFLSNSSTALLFKNFIDYSAITSIDGNNLVKISKDEFIKQITNLAIDYVKRDINKNLNYLEVENLFKATLKLIEQKLNEQVPNEIRYLPFLVEQKFMELEKRLIDNIEFVQREKIDDNFEALRCKYINLLRSNNQKQFIFGLSSVEMSKFYIPPSFIDQKTAIQDKKINKLDATLEKVEIRWKNIFFNSNMISIIGGPGFGKTLFLKSLLINYSSLNIIGNNELLPVYCNLKDFAVNTGESIEDFILESMRKTTGLSRDEIKREFIKYYIDSGKCLLLFDALDEVERNERERLSRLIISFFENKNSNNKICITTRAKGLIPDTPVVLKVANISIFDLQKYVNNMVKIGKIEQADVPIILKQCAPILKSGFLTNFLMLSLMVQIFKAERKIPENKIDLYDKCTDYIYRYREIEEKMVKYNFDLMKSIINNNLTFEKLSFLCKPNNNECTKENIENILMSTYSLRYPDENSALNAILEFLKYCSERTELFVMGSDGKYKFYHRSFFEFYYSKYIIRNFNEDELLIELNKFEKDSEVFELLIALQKRDDYERYVLIQSKFISKFKSIINDSTVEMNQTLIYILFDFMSVCEEHKLLLEFNDLLFNEKRILDAKDLSLQDKMIVAISKIMDFPMFFENLCKYYRQEVISAIILEVTNHKFENFAVVNNNLIDVLSNFIVTILDKHSVKVSEFLRTIDFEEYDRIFNLTIQKFKFVGDEQVVFTNVHKSTKKKYYNRLCS